MYARHCKFSLLGASFFFISIHFIELAVTFILLGSSLIPLGLAFEIFFFLGGTRFMLSLGLYLITKVNPSEYSAQSPLSLRVLHLTRTDGHILSPR